MDKSLKNKDILFLRTTLLLLGSPEFVELVKISRKSKFKQLRPNLTILQKTLFQIFCLNIAI